MSICLPTEKREVLPNSVTLWMTHLVVIGAELSSRCLHYGGVDRRECGPLSLEFFNFSKDNAATRSAFAVHQKLLLLLINGEMT